MIILAPALQALMSSDESEMFFCVRVKHLRLTNFYRDIVLPDGTYMSSDLVADVEAPVLNSAVDRSLYKVMFCDNNKILTNLYDSSLIGGEFTVRAVFVDPATRQPLVSDTLIVYDGVVQGFEQTVETGEYGETKTVIIGSNPMAALDATASFFCTKENIQELDPTDTAFDQIYEGSGKLTLKWGKK
jgi:hypothetical protein